ncbi:hypothetical protein SAMN04487866_11542 [Thermoactinomyces sp. DSM 45891]|uniref:hypothetical protein n=1 Tax=Thermoactinomyces sp. DSM 45891 TaxID=1761907 RepID=UPI00091B3D08|nr:hypothetical protein [Thermoactinomyces sp. DSM 45891]SFX65039.1 hypothetical protein SAMN04487866_11542 [Thermoactinomyces sp. DSM 45891]
MNSHCNMGFHTRSRPAHFMVVHVPEDQDSKFQSTSLVQDPKLNSQILDLIKYFEPAIETITSGPYQKGSRLNVAKVITLANALDDGGYDYHRSVSKSIADLEISEHMDEVTHELSSLAIGDVIPDLETKVIEAMKKVVSDLDTQLFKEQGKDWTVITDLTQPTLTTIPITYGKISYTYQQVFGYESDLFIRLLLLSSQVTITNLKVNPLFLTPSNIASIDSTTSVFKVYQIKKQS